MEAQYPTSLPQLGLVARLAQNDPQIQAIRSSSTVIDQAAMLISDGHSEKAAGPPVADLLQPFRLHGKSSLFSRNSMRDEDW